MADASGVLKVDDAQRSAQLSDEVVLLVIEHGGAHKRHPFAAIDRDLLLLLDKGRIARLLDQSRRTAPPPPSRRTGCVPLLVCGRGAAPPPPPFARFPRLLLLLREKGRIARLVKK